jgi:hypothetical protein
VIVCYLLRGRRVRMPDTIPLEEAVQQMTRLKRQGLTAWIVDDDMRFVPVPGAMREPAWIE